jgi:hypothetical protein
MISRSMTISRHVCCEAGRLANVSVGEVLQTRPRNLLLHVNVHAKGLSEREDEDSKATTTDCLITPALSLRHIRPHAGLSAQYPRSNHHASRCPPRDAPKRGKGACSVERSVWRTLTGGADDLSSNRDLKQPLVQPYPKRTTLRALSARCLEGLSVSESLQVDLLTANIDESVREYFTIYVHQCGLANAYYMPTSRIYMRRNASGWDLNPAYSTIYCPKPSTARPGRVYFDPFPGI